MNQVLYDILSNTFISSSILRELMKLKIYKNTKMLKIKVMCLDGP